ncbi:DNA topoisomerase III [Alkaliphilus serpentinus]|uniref:DNA topoisomerase 3 n=1 Tax=Alkaliphilus serpentinus TaxID=1482731 RepID=A0A833MEM9_9FIRM|nr:DNA topoisomerase III [Alkaliphilus serpentinus]KAB3531519.1 DNA topoisomerase III [Alkaliphilus serpentinus]
MGLKLVLAEKPSVARDIARVLGCTKKGNGYIEGAHYVVTWALGHLVTHADPEIYNDRFKTWRIEDLPIIPKPMKLVVIKQTGKQFHSVKEQILRKDVSEIIIATDAGREGELVARWIIEKCRVKKPIKRLWISSVTDKAIKDGFNNLRNGKDFENLYESAVARAEADWIVGINATRALTVKYNAQLSCGRVQTPTLAMIARREEEIKSFKPKTYYGITAQTEDLKLIWQEKETKEPKTFDLKKIEMILSSIRNKEGKIIDIDKANKKVFAPQLYSLTELQREANNIFGYSAKETLSIMQSLYENHKLLTYPRTDSRYISKDIVDTLKDRITACGVGPYKGITTKLLKESLKVHKSFVDDSKVTDHHAIIPTEVKAFLGALNEKEKRIYDLVVKRFLAVLHPPFIYQQTTIKAAIGEEVFLARGKIIIDQGWKMVYNSSIVDEDDDDPAEQFLPAVNKGDTVKIVSINQTKGETKPPQPFNEGTLLSAMENPVQYMPKDDKELIKTIGEAGGIGTVATRADIIEKLFSSFVIEKRGREIYITSKGLQLLQLAPEDIKSPALTAEWEQKLADIAKGIVHRDGFIGEIINYTKDIVHEIKNSNETFRHDNLTKNKCPECGKYLLEVKGKKGKLYVCQDRECGYRKGISKVTNARCPNCHKKLELRGEGEGQIFVCQCGYKEKLTAFKERKKNETGKPSKKEVAKFMKEQSKTKDEPINTALADALSKLKLK